MYLLCSFEQASGGVHDIISLHVQMAICLYAMVQVLKQILSSWFRYVVFVISLYAMNNSPQGDHYI